MSLLSTFREQLIPPPVPPLFQPKLSTYFGDIDSDHFYDMRELKNRGVRSYLKEENLYFRKMTLSDTFLFRRINHEIRKRIPEEDCSVPVEIGPYLYYNRTKIRRNYPIYCRRKKDHSTPEEILLDVNILAGKTDCCLVTGLAVSPDHSRLVYAINLTGGIDYDLKIKDLITQKTLQDCIRCTDGEAAWSEDNQHLFYTLRQKGDLRAFRVMRHKIGTSVKDDVCLYEESDPTFECSVWKTKSDRWIMISATSSVTAEHRFADARNPFAPFTLIAERRSGIEYYPEHLEDRFFILTNQDGAEDFKMMTVPVCALPTLSWEEFIPHLPGTLLEDFELFNGYAAVLERNNAIPRIRIVSLDSGKTQIYTLPNAAPGTLAFDDNPNIDATCVRIAKSTLTSPFVTADLTLSTLAEIPLKVQTVGNFNPDNYDSIMLRVPSRDGKEIPLSLVWRKDKRTSAPSPLLMRGYGAYGISSDPGFRPSRLSLLDRGMICAIAHVRGGEELGRAWYEGGRLMNKKNTFYDFIDCAEFLIREGWTSPEQLIISGGSAGGLLMGAVINERPELFLAAVMEVPFVDVINTMTDPSLPLTTGEYSEWGNPADPKAYAYIKSYSPYDNISEQNYPHLFLSGSLNDSQVPFWEPAKFAAKLRRISDNKGLVLLKTEMKSGHLGPTGRKAEISEIAREFTFCLSVCGING